MVLSSREFDKFRSAYQNLESLRKRRKKLVSFQGEPRGNAVEFMGKYWALYEDSKKAVDEALKIVHGNEKLFPKSLFCS